MSDLMKRENRGKLALGAGGVAGGIGLLAVMGVVASSWPVALVVGAVVLWGSWKLFQKPNSALIGMVGLAAGVVIAATGLPLVGGLAKLLLTLSGIGLIGSGVWAIYQVFKNRRS